MADKMKLAAAWNESRRPSEPAKPGDPEVEKLRAQHPAHRARAREWQFFGDSYYGGSRYLEGGYLIRHPNEEDDDYEHRRQVACYYNYCQEVVDLYVSYLFQKAAEIDYGNLAKDDLFESFRKDADLKGNSFNAFLRESQRLASAYGHIAIIIDKPKVIEGEVQTRLDEKERNIRPYVYRALPTHIINWKYERIGTEGYRLTYLKVKESSDPERYRIWTQEKWELWEIREEKAALIDNGSNPLGKIPAVILCNLAGDQDLIGRSDLTDIAYINKHIFNLLSWNDENIENTCFAMLARAKREAGEEGQDDDTVGPGYVVEYDPEAPNDKPFWIEPPSVTQEVFEKRLERDISEIHRIAKMGGVGATEVDRAAKSGIALELEFRQMNSTLAEKADNVEEAHKQICELFCEWQEMDAFGGTINYPDDFNVEDLATDLDNALNAISLRISSRFNAEMKKRLVRVALPKLKPEIRKEVEDQIEAQADLFIPAEFGLMLQYNLSNPVDIVMALRGVDEAEAKKMLERNRELNKEYGLTKAPSPPDLAAAFGEAGGGSGEAG